MLIGFILTIIVVLVVIVLMSTGTLDGVIGSEHTKSSKVMTEIASISHSTQIYKSITKDRDYKDLSLDKLVQLGIIKQSDLIKSTSTMFYLNESDFNSSNLTKLKDGEINVVASKALPGVYFNIKENKENSNEFLFEVIIDKSISGIGFKEKDYLIEKALESGYNKFEQDAVIKTGTGTSTTDGVATIIFK